jgi:GNAT superfamily N-acetyltransferase
MTVAIAPLTGDHIPEAAALFDRWYDRMRGRAPRRPGAGLGEGLLAAALDAPGADRAPAVGARSAAGTLLGYLAVTPLDLAPDDPRLLTAHPRAALVALGAHALREGGAADRTRPYDVLRELYASVAEWLVADRRRVHYVELPAGETAAHAWFRLGFGLERVRGVMPVRPRGRQPRGVEALGIRRAGSGDLPLLGRLAVEAARHQRGTAVFRPQPETALAALPAHCAAVLGDPGAAAWVAARRGEEIGMVVLRPLPEADPLLPEGCVELAQAYVAPAARGAGISRVLLATALAWAYDHGYRHVTASWDAASPESAGHWPAVGFEPVGYRLQRCLDPRLD